MCYRNGKSKRKPDKRNDTPSKETDDIKERSTKDLEIEQLRLFDEARRARSVGIEESSNIPSTEHPSDDSSRKD